MKLPGTSPQCVSGTLQRAAFDELVVLYVPCHLMARLELICATLSPFPANVDQPTMMNLFMSRRKDPRALEQAMAFIKHEIAANPVRFLLIGEE